MAEQAAAAARGVPGQERRALLAAAATGVLVGSGIVASRGVVEVVGPINLALLRYAVGLVCLLPVVLLGARVRVRGADLVPIGLLGIGQFGVLIVLLNVGLRSVPSAQAAVLFATLPLWTLVLSAALGHERFSLLKILSVLLSILSVAAVLAPALLSTVSSLAPLGSLAVLASAACGALCSVLYRPYVRRYPALPVSALAMFASVVFLAALAALDAALPTLAAQAALSSSSSLPFSQLPPNAWAAIAFVGLSSAAGYFLWLWALGHTTPTRVTVFLALSPITASLLGLLLLGEPVSAWTVIGIAGVALSLWLIQVDQP